MANDEPGKQTVISGRGHSLGWLTCGDNEGLGDGLRPSLCSQESVLFLRVSCKLTCHRHVHLSAPRPCLKNGCRKSIPSHDLHNHQKQKSMADRGSPWFIMVHGSTSQYVNKRKRNTAHEVYMKICQATSPSDGLAFERKTL